MCASSKGDANLSDFIESEYLQNQVDSIKELSDMYTQLSRVGEGVGVFIMDRELLEAMQDSSKSNNSNDK